MFSFFTDICMKSGIPQRVCVIQKMLKKYDKKLSALRCCMSPIINKLKCASFKEEIISRPTLTNKYMTSFGCGL